MIEDPRVVAKKFAVPLKSLKRWLQVGPERRKGKKSSKFGK
jgi:hypothetical protein